MLSTVTSKSLGCFPFCFWVVFYILEFINALLYALETLQRHLGFSLCAAFSSSVLCADNSSSFDVFGHSGPSESSRLCLQPPPLVKLRNCLRAVGSRTCIEFTSFVPSTCSLFPDVQCLTPLFHRFCPVFGYFTQRGKFRFLLPHFIQKQKSLTLLLFIFVNSES